MKRLIFVALLLALAAPERGFAQFASLGEAPLLSVGVTGARFRISYDAFDQFYDSKWGGAWGAYGAVRVSRRYNAILKYREFSKSGSISTNGATAALEWKERWINAGVRLRVWSDRGLVSYFGGGLAFFSVEENGDILILPRVGNSMERSSNEAGLFLDFGLHYRLLKRAALDFEIEITSASIGGGGFQTTSIGGFFVGAGVSIFPF